MTGNFKIHFAVAPGIGKIGEATMEHHTPCSDIGDIAGLGKKGSFLSDLPRSEGTGIGTIEKDTASQMRLQPQSGADKSALPAAIRPQ